MSVRVRFAPSPTGYLHVGGLRTALYNYLFAKHHGGSFVLRIEDTDQSRKVEGAVENLIRTLRWAGLDYDEGPEKGGPYGPYVQSERLSTYREHATRLVESGKAYYCFCTSERLDELRQKQQALKLPPSYDRHCRDLPREESAKRVADGEGHVVRMKVPIGGEMTFEDRIRGKVTIAHKVIDDQVLLKSDGFPTYHLAVVVDDHHMAITHVIRGEEWLPSTPKHILLYQYFGWDAPEFAHLPLLLNADRSKLSKRQGDVAVEDYRAKGYLRDAIVNFVAFLGWNPGDERELFSLEDLVRDFSLERVGKAGAVFNVEKLQWLNQQHLRRQGAADLVPQVRQLIVDRGWTVPPDAAIERAIHLMRERVTFVHDFVEFSDYLFRDPDQFDPEARAKSWPEGAADRVRRLADRLEGLSTFDHPSIEAALKDLATDLQIKPGLLVHPTRYALSGKTVGPGLYELMEFLGRETVLRRLRHAITNLG
ncbi:MAG: glutamate--tRNA ligase [Bacteroidetes bacterium]|jgi:glutamyl-tRNA synthetase|nr:glutamate--tRNA ligase [Bacteroidota bacterium]